MKRTKQAMAIGLVLAAVMLTVLFGFNEARAGDAAAGYPGTAGGERGQAGVGNLEAATATARNAGRPGSVAAAVNGEKVMLLACFNGNCKTISVDELFETGLAFAAGSEVRGQRAAAGGPADASRNAGDAPGTAPGKAQANPGGKMMLACGGGGICDTIPVKELLGSEIRLACFGGNCKSTSTSELLGDEVRLTMRLPEAAAGATVGTGATLAAGASVSAAATGSAGATGQAKLARAESTTHGLASPPTTTSKFTQGLHGEPTNYGFASARQATPAAKAFAAGLFAARKLLAGANNPQPMPEAPAPTKAAVAGNETRRAAEAWLQSEQSDYFRCGWWAMNLLTICHFDAATLDQFWTYQVHSLENIRKTFAGLPGPEARMILETVRELDRPIQALVRDPDNRRAAAAVESELEQLTKRLSPEAA